MYHTGSSLLVAQTKYGAKCLKVGPPMKQQFRGNRLGFCQELPRHDE